MKAKQKAHLARLQYAQSEGIDETERQTFLVPFVVLAFLSLPSLVVLAYGKASAQYGVLSALPFIGILKVLFWVLVPLIAIFGVLYLVRDKSLLGRLAVLMIMLLVIASFSYFIFPA